MTSKIEKWVKAGYQLLATDEIDGINIERLARALKANKSGFYHYFGTKEEYFKHLVRHHIRLAQRVAVEIQHCNTIDPDLLLVIVKEKIFFLVEGQLLVKGNLLKGKVDTTEAGRIVTDEVVALWQNLNEPFTDWKSALATVDIIRHYFYARIDAQNMNYKFLHTLAEELKGMPNVHVYEKSIPSFRRGSDQDKLENASA
jgi:AcrR family transcriptional regulator